MRTKEEKEKLINGGKTHENRGKSQNEQMIIKNKCGCQTHEDLGDKKPGIMNKQIELMPDILRKSPKLTNEWD